MSEKLERELESIEIDDERDHILTIITKPKKGVIKVESDHNMIFSKFKIAWNSKIQEKRNELFDLKNR